MGPTLFAYQVGQRVRITQQMPRQINTLNISIEGVIVRFGQQKTGSWYAHAKDDKLWLDRLELKRDDGELVVLNMDRYTVVSLIDTQDATRAAAGR